MRFKILGLIASFAMFEGGAEAQHVVRGLQIALEIKERCSVRMEILDQTSATTYEECNASRGYKVIAYHLPGAAGDVTYDERTVPLDPSGATVLAERAGASIRAAELALDDSLSPSDVQISIVPLG